MKIHKTIILSVFYKCETSSLMLKEEHWRVFENRALRGIFEAKRK
jgi:hypothetical protein